MTILETITQECDDLYHSLEGSPAQVDATAFRDYLMSCALYMWGCNTLYSTEYADALRAISGTTFTHVQIITAMSCCADAEAPLSVPAFFSQLAESDGASHQHRSRDFVDALTRTLVNVAFINGDFTIHEATALLQLSGKLTACCDAHHVAAVPQRLDILSRVTPIRETGYRQAVLSEDDTPTEDPPSPPGTPPQNTAVHQSDLPNEEADDDDDDDASSADAPANTSATPPTEVGSLEELSAELDGLVGLDCIKKDVRGLMNFIRICRLRQERGMKIPTISYHLVFTGNPGTGKTTVARLIAKLYYRMGLLSGGQLVETDRSALVAGYLGQTAIKTQKVIQSALGGVLFIDEAYSLAANENDSYGQEATETLLKAMEDHRNDLVVIVAGYDELMHHFIDSNPGLRSRFSKYFHFPDYTGEEMTRIFARFCQQNGYLIDEATTSVLRAQFDEAYAHRTPHFGNARDVRNLFEHAINAQADRLAECGDLTDDALSRLTLPDILPPQGGAAL